MRQMTISLLLCFFLQISFAQNFHPIGNFSEFVPELKFSHNGKILAACIMGGPSGSLELYDVQSEKLVATIPCYPSFVLFSNNDSIVYVRISLKSFGAYNISNLSEPKKISEFPAEEVRCADLSVDESILALGLDDGQAMIIDMKTNQVITSSRPFESTLFTHCCYNSCLFCPVWHIKIIDKQHYLIGGTGSSGEVKILDFNKNIFFSKSVSELDGWSADRSGQHFLLYTAGGSLIYGINGGTSLIGRTGARFSATVFSPSGKYIAGLKDGSLTLHDGVGKTLTSVKEKKFIDNVRIVAVSEDDKHIAWICHDALIIGDFEAIINKSK